MNIQQRPPAARLLFSITVYATMPVSDEFEQGAHKLYVYDRVLYVTFTLSSECFCRHVFLLRCCFFVSILYSYFLPPV